MKTCLLLLPLVLLLPACGHGHDHAHPPQTAGGAVADDHHGTPHALGAVRCGAHEFAVTQLGDVKAGGEAAIEITSAAGGEITATLRAWIGTADAAGSRKARLVADGPGKLHGHVEAPSPLAEGAQLWIEVDGSDGVVAGSVALHR